MQESSLGSSMEPNCEGLEKKLQYSFQDRALLKRALSHRSYCHEFARSSEEREDNERLEFLGDSVLQLVISHILSDYYPKADEGKLSKMRAFLVNVNGLTKVAKDIDLGLYLLLGKGEEVSGGREKNSILSSSYEALLGAVYTEGGFTTVFKTIAEHFKLYLKEASSAIVTGYDFKSLLQERAQEYFRATPSYEVENMEGPEHRRQFTVAVKLLSHEAQGKGESKKEAEQDAASLLLKTIEEKHAKSNALDSI